MSDPANDLNDLRARLRNLRAVTNHPRPERPPTAQPPFAGSSIPLLSGSPQPLEKLIPGELHDTPHGDSYVVRENHAPGHVHGSSPLDGWLSQNLIGAAAFTKDRRLAAVDPRRCLFLDTETTGLNGGAGTLVFLVGVGRFTDDGFEVRQYFLRNPAEEPALLHALETLLDEHEALVTFNGRSFDVPLLSSRYVMNGWRLDFERWPNLDLLHPARRLWKRRLESCRLSALEGSVLGVERTGADVPGWMIPQLYYDFVRTGDARQMQRVMYHNLMDVLSMVTLATYLCSTFAQPDTASAALPPDDLLSLGRWYDALDMPQAESAYLAALHTAYHDADRRLILELLATLLKRQDRRAEAAQHWQAYVALAPLNPRPMLELSMYHEWTTGDVIQATEWAERAFHAVTEWPPSPVRHSTLEEIQHRLERLLRKSRP